MKKLFIITCMLLSMNIFSYTPFQEETLIYGMRDLEVELAKESPSKDILDKRLRDVKKVISVSKRLEKRLDTGKYAKRYTSIIFETEQEITRQSVYNVKDRSDSYCKLIEDITLYSISDFKRMKTDVIESVAKIMSENSVPFSDSKKKTLIQAKSQLFEILEFAKKENCSIYQSKSDIYLINMQDKECAEKIVEHMNKNKKRVEIVNEQYACEVKQDMFSIMIGVDLPDELEEDMPTGVYKKVRSAYEILMNSLMFKI